MLRELLEPLTASLGTPRAQLLLGELHVRLLHHLVVRQPRGVARVALQRDLIVHRVKPPHGVVLALRALVLGLLERLAQRRLLLPVLEHALDVVARRDHLDLLPRLPHLL